MNDEILAAVGLSVGHEPPFSAAELTTVTQIAVVHARDLDGLDELPGLRILQLVGCDLENVSGLRGCRDLTLLDVTASRLGDLSALGDLRSLRELSIRCADVIDLSPLRELEDLVALSAIGCPLDETSYHDLAVELRARYVDVVLSDPESWQLTRELWAAGLPGCVYESDGVQRLCAPGLSVTATPEAGQPAITSEELRAELAAGPTLEEMYSKYGPTYTPSTEPVVEWDPLRLRKRGSADDARRWLVEAELPDEYSGPLMRFVDDFPTLDYLRETAGLFAEVEARDGVELPAWLRQIRSVLAAPFHETGVVHLELSEFPGIDFRISGEFGVYEIRGPVDGAERRQTVELADVYPVVSGGAGAMYVLAAKLAEPDNDALYFYHSSDLSERADGVEVFGALRHYVDLFDLATAVTLRDGTRIERRRRDGGGPSTDPSDGDPLAMARKAVSNAAGDSATKADDTATADGADDVHAAGEAPADGQGMRLLAALTGTPTDELATSDGFNRGVSGLAIRLASMATARLGRDEAARAEATQEFGTLVAVLRDHGIPIPQWQPEESDDARGWRADPPGEPGEPAAKFQARVNDVLTDIVSQLEYLRQDVLPAEGSPAE